MFCKKCGSEIDDDSVFCQECGIKIDEKSHIGEQAAPPQPQQEAPGFPPKPAEDSDEERDLWEGSRSSRKYLLYNILIIALLIAGAVLVFYIPKDLWEGKGALEKIGKLVRYIPFIVMLFIFGMLSSKVWLFTHKIKYRLTTERFFVTKGIISRSIEELELIRVNDVIMNQGVWERLLGYGRVTILSNDETAPELILDYIADPEYVKEQIRSAAARKRKSGLFVERI